VCCIRVTNMKEFIVSGKGTLFCHLLVLILQVWYVCSDFDVSSHFVNSVRPRTSSAPLDPDLLEKTSCKETCHISRHNKLFLLIAKEKLPSKERERSSSKSSTDQPKRPPKQSSPLAGGRTMSDYFDSEADRESYRLEKFGKLLAGPNTDLEALGQLSWAGIPAAVRGTTWQLLLVCNNYHNTLVMIFVNRDIFHQILTGERRH